MVRGIDHCGEGFVQGPSCPKGYPEGKSSAKGARQGASQGQSLMVDSSIQFQVFVICLAATMSQVLVFDIVCRHVYHIDMCLYRNLALDILWVCAHSTVLLLFNVSRTAVIGGPEMVTSLRRQRLKTVTLGLVLRKVLG